MRRFVVESGYPELALAALHHDSHEAYLCDMPSPLESKIFTATQLYDDICRGFDRTIAEAFDFEYPEKASEEKAGRARQRYPRGRCSRPRGQRRTQVATTALPFSAKLDADGATSVRLIA